MATAQRPHLTKEQLSHFRDALLDKRRALMGSVESLTRDAMESTVSTENSKSPLNIADNASDAFEQDFAFLSIESEEELLRKIDGALVLFEEQSYGNCVECSKPIPLERLEIMPWAMLCVKCQSREERFGRKRRSDDEFEVISDDIDYNPAGDDKD